MYACGHFDVRDCDEFCETINKDYANYDEWLELYLQLQIM